MRKFLEFFNILGYKPFGIANKVYSVKPERSPKKDQISRTVMPIKGITFNQWYKSNGKAYHSLNRLATGGNTIGVIDFTTFERIK